MTRLLPFLCLALIHSPLDLSAQNRHTLGVWETSGATYHFQRGGRLEIVRQDPHSPRDTDPSFAEILRGSWSADATRLRIVLESVDFRFGDLHSEGLGFETFLRRVGEKLRAEWSHPEVSAEEAVASTTRRLRISNDSLANFLSVEMEGPYHITSSSTFGFEVSAASGTRTWSMSISTDNGTVTAIEDASWGQVKLIHR